VGPLREAAFRRMWASQAASMMGDGLVPVALSFAVISLGGGAAEIGLVLGAQWVAMVAFVLAGGVVADRFPRRRVLIVADLVRLAVQATSAILLLSDAATVSYLAALMAAYGAAEAFVRPATTALLPRTVPPEGLQQANALLGLTWNMGAVLGPALGGALVVLFEPGGALAAQALTYAVSAGFLFSMRVPGGDVVAPSGEGVLGDLRGGLREVGKRGWLWWTILVVAVWLLIAEAPFTVLGPLISERELGGAAAWATILTAYGIGGLAGGAVALAWKPKRPLFAGALLLALEAPSLALLAFGAPVPAIAATAFLGGAATGIFVTLWDTALQQNVPGEALGRVSAVDWGGSTALLPLGFVLVGPAVALLGERGLLLFAALVTVVLSLATVARRDVRELRQPETAKGAEPGVEPETMRCPEIRTHAEELSVVTPIPEAKAEATDPTAEDR
jgi:predicted MFS family arabinose efflux permease